MSEVSDPILDVAKNQVLSLYDQWVEVYNYYWAYSYDSTIMYRQPVLSGLIPIGAIFAYALALYFIPKFMEKRKPMQLGYIPFLWNSFLCILSVVMVLGLATPIVNVLIREGGIFSGQAHWYIICKGGDDPMLMGEIPSTFATWVYVFAGSKFLELFDTVILMLRKRKVIFLHWYHHMSVLIMTWYLSHYHVQIGAYFAIMNGTVHMMLYYYYAMASIGRRPTWGVHLTTIQILQMVFGTIINGVWTYSLFNQERLGCSCWNYCYRMFAATAVMYASYGALFTKLFIDRWILKKAKPTLEADKKKKEKKTE